MGMACKSSSLGQGSLAGSAIAGVQRDITSIEDSCCAIVVAWLKTGRLCDSLAGIGMSTQGPQRARPAEESSGAFEGEV
jgi:hypothetical protein